MKHDGKRILVSWSIDPRLIAPFTLSKRQVTVGTRENPDQPMLMFSAWTPQHRYDLHAAVRAQGIDTKFDLVVVWADSTFRNLPLNLDAFDCPKLLCAGDTHHLPTPLRGLIGYALEARYDFVLSTYDRHHLHWFAEAGLANVGWFPGLTVRPVSRPITAQRAPQVAFFGSLTGYHPRRRRLLEQMHAAGLPVFTSSGTLEAGADLYAASLLSFNASLNGDLNLRVFETLSAGGCLLTDRLSRQSGLDLIVEDGTDYLSYGSPEELIDKARYFLAHPAEALAVAQAGQRACQRSLSPRRLVDALLGWVFDGRLAPEHRVAFDKRHAASAMSESALVKRLMLYEHLQELHRVSEQPRVLLIGKVDPIHAADAGDLPRLQLAWLTSGGGEPDGAEANAEDRVVRITRDQARQRPWDRIIMPADEALPPGITCEEVLAL